MAVAANKDKARAILSYATPNPVGPYRLITPPSPDLGRKTQTPVMPIMGGALVNLPNPVKPTKQTTPVAPPMAGKLVNVPKQQGRVVDASDHVTDAELVTMKVRNGWLPDKYKDDVDAIMQSAPEKFKNDLQLSDRYQSLVRGAESRGFTGKNAEIRAAEFMYQDIDKVKRSGVPVENVLDIIALPDTTDLLDHFAGNRSGLRTHFVQENIPTKVVSTDVVYQTIANDLRGLNKIERRTYISLLPGWTGTHKELANAARSLSK
jgi:hypothetical protein